ncbi:hypothetical protein [Streptomyces sp. KR80]|uniref:hypothetical protein n=1 Tax=Streptomyces sp. KR80 TaxID=3457426 RepID=UPI003FD0CF82
MDTVDYDISTEEAAALWQFVDRLDDGHWPGFDDLAEELGDDVLALVQSLEDKG